MTITELYEQIGEMLEQEGFDGSRTVLGIHQPNYPIQESIGGVVDPEAQHERCRVPGKEICMFCEQTMAPGGVGPDDPSHVEGWALVDADGDLEGWAHLACKAESDEDKGSSVVYLVLSGTSPDHNPYGPNVWGMQ